MTPLSGKPPGAPRIGKSNRLLFVHAVLPGAGGARDLTQSAALRVVTEENGSIAQTLVDNVVDYAIYLLDLDGTEKSWNAGAQRIKGYSAEEIIGRNFSAFFMDDDLRAIAPDVPGWVDGDPTRLRQILLNLLSNALKFIESGRVAITVHCESQTDGDLLRFEISDTGIGIAAENQHLLFEKFSQVDRSDSRKFGGSGLGLAISRRLAEAMSGTIRVTSEVDADSVFWFTARREMTDLSTVASSSGWRRLSRW